MTRRWLAIATCPLIAAGAAAQTAPVVTITGSSSAYDARRDDTAARIVLGRAELKRFGDTSVSDTLKRQPGITVDAAGTLAMRGLAKGYTQILLNGERVPAGFALDGISPELVERIEISRVPTADQRAEAIAGTINIVLRKAGRRSARSAKLQTTRSRGKTGAFASAELAEPGARWSWQLALSSRYTEPLISFRQRSTGFDAGGQPDLLRDTGLDLQLEGRVLSLAPSATLKLDNGDTVSLQAYGERRLFDKDGRAFSDTRLGSFEAVVRDTQLTDEANTEGRASVEWLRRGDGRSMEFKLSGAQLRRSADFRQQGWDPAGQVNLQDHTASGVDERSVKLGGRYSQRLNDAHTLAAGWEAERTTRWEDRRQRVRRDSAQEAFLYFDFDAVIARRAFYLQDEWTAGPLALYLGVRSERIALDTTGRDFAPVGRVDDLFSPSVQMLWKPAGAQGRQVRLGLARTYKAPAPVALIPRPYTSTNNTFSNPDERGNPQLRPELATGLDGAYEHHWANGAMASIGGYLRRIDGVTRDALLREQGRWVIFPVNGGKARLHGLEFDTRLKLSDWLAGAPKLDLRWTFTRNWSRVDDLPGPDNRIGDQPRLSTTIGADYALNAQLVTGISASYKRGGVARTAWNRYTLSESRAECDAYLLWTIAPGWKLRMAVSNLLAEDQVSGSRYLDGAGTRQVQDTRTMPAALRIVLEYAR